MTADSPDLWLTLLRDLSAKSALLLLAALAVTLAMRRASASARHLVWLLLFAGLLALSLTLPTRPVPALPAAPVATVSVPIAAVRAAVSDRLPAPSVSVTPSSVRPVLPAPPVRPPLLCLFWLLGAVLTLAPVILGLALAGRRLRRCRLVTDPAALALAAEAARRLGVRRSIPLRSGPSVSVPVTFGLMRPVILLPDGAASWPAERLHVALLHELAHVQRDDWATQTVARLVCALFWHNPLVWVAARMLRAEAERACDDLVLSSGVPAPDYAQHLLVVAAALSSTIRPLPLAVPMAGRGLLESRLRAVLSSRPRRALSRRRAVLALVLALVVLVPLAALRPAARAALRVTPLLPHAPAITPAPPKAVRHFPAPVKATVVAPPAPTPTQSTPIGVPPMKTLTPVKTVALAALAATLTLPAAQAKPTSPAQHLPLSVAALPHMRLQAALPTRNDTVPINFATQGDVTNGVAMLFQGSHRNYVIEPGVSGSVNVHLSGIPFDKALTTLLGASSQPLEYKIQDGVYHIRPRASGTEMQVPDLGSGGIVSGDPIKVSNPLVSLDLKKAPIRQALDTLFTAAGANYTVAAGVSDDNNLVTVHLTAVPLDQALDAVLASSATPLMYRIQRGGIQRGGIFVVMPKHVFGLPFGGRAAPARPGSAANPFAAPLPAGVSPVKPDAAKVP